jgi:glycerophosphoryl diester phosphodiesterase
VTSAPNPWIRPGHPIRIAHRGVRARIPEHTLPSLEAAIAGGADMIEADGRLTRDGVLVLMHDATVDRTTDGHGPIADMTWTEVARLDAGTGSGTRFAGLRVLRVADLVVLARDANVALCLEAKGESPAQTAIVAEALARLAADHDALGWAFVSSFDHAALAHARSIVPELLIAPERLPEHGPQPAEVIVAQARALSAPVIQHRWETLDRATVDALHDARIAVWAWNTNDAESVARTLASGADGLVSDDIGILATGTW